MTAKGFIQELRESEWSVKEICEGRGVTYAKVAQWRRRNKWFRKRYDDIMAQRSREERAALGDFNQLFPGWKSLFLTFMDEQLPETPKISVACDKMQNLGVPITTKHVYACSSPRCKQYYDADFALELRACEAPALEQIKEQLFQDLKDGKAPGVAHKLLSTHEVGPFSARQEIVVEGETKHHHEHRHEIQAQLSEESQALAAGIRKRLEAGNGEPTERGSAAEERGEDSGQRGDEELLEAEDVIEGEILVEEEVLEGQHEEEVASSPG